jgi:biopolymer transport protein ExbB/TolQ
MQALEVLMYEIARLFMAPVLIVLLCMFTYAFFALGAFLWDGARPGARQGTLAAYRRRKPDATLADIELRIMRILEPLRLTSRTAPMLGLVATMIPMGPALVAVTSGNARGVSQNLVVAFSAVIIALLSAAITFMVLSVRRRWLMIELEALRPEFEPVEVRNG